MDRGSNRAGRWARVEPGVDLSRHRARHPPVIGKLPELPLAVGS
jgi:hypothetical protein